MYIYDKYLQYCLLAKYRKFVPCDIVIRLSCIYVNHSIWLKQIFAIQEMIFQVRYSLINDRHVFKEFLSEVVTMHKLSRFPWYKL